jgi:aminoglycoside phosphotransferase (APT) family kinase protein
MYDAVIETLARIHKVDWKMLGLADYGKPGNYFTRQFSRWTKQWFASKTREIPEVDRLIEWLPKHMPQSEETTVCHGDFRIGNVMFHPSNPSIIAVFDWELSTLGHPLADVAYLCMLYHQTADEFGGLLGADCAVLGIPTQEQFVARYRQLTGRADSVQAFHMIFSMFRMVAILEGVRARALAGNIASRDGREVSERAVILARRAVAMIDS